MWGIDPCAGAHKQRRLTGIPEGSSGLPSTPCCRVWCQVGRRSHKSSYLRRFIREAASGAHLSDPPWGSELGSWSSARLALDPFLSRQMLLCFFFDSACLSALKLCHTPGSCSGRPGVGDDDCFRPLLGNGLDNLASLRSAASQPASRDSSGNITMV